MTQFIKFINLMGTNDIIKESNTFFAEHPEYRIVTTNYYNNDVKEILIVGYLNDTEVNQPIN